MGDDAMTRWWMSVALAVLWLGQGTATRAQYLPIPKGSPPPAEPVPVSLTEPALPGPLPPHNAPPGPCDELGLPASVPGAFSDRVLATEQGVYLHLGSSGMSRQSTTNRFIAIRD